MMREMATRVPQQWAAPRKAEIHSVTIPYFFHEIWADRATGVVSFSAQGVTKSVQFSNGRVLFASSNDRDDRLNQVLLRAGAVTLKDLLKALEVSLATKDRLGEVLVRWKMVGEDVVADCVKKQVREIILSLFQWTRGEYAFEPRPASAEAVTIGVPGDLLVVEGVKRIASWARIYEQVGGLNAEYLATNGADEIVRALPFTEGERALLEMSREPISLGEMCEKSGLTDYEDCKAVWTLLIVGALMKV